VLEKVLATLFPRHETSQQRRKYFFTATVIRRPGHCASLGTPLVILITRATKSQSQNFYAVLKVHETSTNQISRSYHEGIPSYYVKKSQNLSLGQNFLAAEFFSLHRYFIETTTTYIDMLLQV